MDMAKTSTRNCKLSKDDPVNIKCGTTTMIGGPWSMVPVPWSVVHGLWFALHGDSASDGRSLALDTISNSSTLKRTAGGRAKHHMKEKPGHTRTSDAASSAQSPPQKFCARLASSRSC